MDEHITVTAAKRGFSRLLEGVRAGRSFTITSYGRPVARIVPVPGRNAQMRATWEALLARLERQPATGLKRTWTREELYEE